MFDSDREKALWLAGLLEGEGYFTIQRKSPSCRGTLRAVVQMTDRDVIERAASLYPTGDSFTIV